ncbi:hypothetical protein [Methylobacterium trifolii]|uniref:Uncharacterized protein n=1 Tax=Methylobacterium trifolii TaxID=1003092 RepID=A0ABQ4U5J2_9HYPH|nr:hypothetical protein [Methylobacterium trifolii]GJE61657.1 hypothetical protein MPOCJGCO_3780 [Methylobacterium trifolii]
MTEATTRSALEAAFGQRVRIRAPDVVGEGSAATLALGRIPGAGLDTVAAAGAHVRWHLPIMIVHRAMTGLFDTGEAVVDVPKVEELSRLTSELQALGIEVRSRLEAR